MMINNVIFEYDTVKDLVLSVLENHPEARDNDTVLYAQCCKKLGAFTIDEMIELNLNVDGFRICTRTKE